MQEQVADVEDNFKLSDKREAKNYSKHSGLSLLKIYMLFKGTFHDMLVREAAARHNGKITRSNTSDVLSCMIHMHKIEIMPLPHWNLMSFVAMRSRNEYLISKTSADGFFTALNKSGDLTTWSTFTGKLLWNENQNSQGVSEANPCCWENMLGYEVYRSDAKDTTYLSNFYCYDNPLDPINSYSLSLLVSKNSVHKE